MARGDLSGAELRKAFQRVNKAFDAAFEQGAVDIARKAVNYEARNAMKRVVVNVYATSLAQMWAASMKQSFNDIDERVANALIKGATAVERATIGETAAERRDNEEIKRVMAEFATLINSEVLEQYLEQFSGRSYREGDPDRRSGGIERYLRKNKVATATGHSVEVSLRSAVNDDDVPHIFRLNYGTKSLTGDEKQGFRAPEFTISMLPGTPSAKRRLEGARRPGFYFPGGDFTYRLTIGGAGQIQLWRSSDFSGPRVGAGTSQKPSAGIAPSYFVEYGLTEAARAFPSEMKHLIDRWKRRVARIQEQA